MKQYQKLFFVLLTLVFSFSAYSQEVTHDNAKWAIRFGIGTPSNFNTDMFKDGGREYDSNYQPLKYHYEGYAGDVYSSGSFSIGADIRLLKWLYFSGDVSLDSHWRNRYSANEGKSVGYSLCVAPSIKIYALNRPMVRIYGSLGLCYVNYFGYETLKYSYSDHSGTTIVVDDTFTIRGQFTPLGIEVGKRLFGFAEFGTGIIFTGVRFGIGYKF